MADDKPIIVVKKKGGHGGHHGGAWKVAYADFVTAMMAFFMVMWLINSASTPTKESIASYFRKPGLFESGSGTPLEIGGAGILEDAAPPKPEEKKKGSGLSQERMKKKTGNDDDDGVKRLTIKGGTGQAVGLLEGTRATHGFNDEEPEEMPKEEGDIEKMREQGGAPGPVPDELQQGQQAGEGQAQEASEITELDAAQGIGTIQSNQQMLQALAQQIRNEIAKSPELQQLIGIVDVKVDADGLNVEIMDTEKTSMFASGSFRILPEAKTAFQKLADIVKKLPNSIDIIGHTDAEPFPTTATGYSNWELSADRANAARRLLLDSGIAPERILSVVGRADRELRNSKDPLAPANRRITLKMRFKGNEMLEPAKDPSTLQKFSDLEQQYTAQKLAPAPTLASGAFRRIAPRRPSKTHTISPQEIINSTSNKPRIIRLPNENSRRRRPSAGKNLIFGDTPVIVAPEIN